MATIKAVANPHRRKKRRAKRRVKVTGKKYLMIGLKPKKNNHSQRVERRDEAMAKRRRGKRRGARRNPPGVLQRGAQAGAGRVVVDVLTGIAAVVANKSVASWGTRAMKLDPKARPVVQLALGILTIMIGGVMKSRLVGIAGLASTIVGGFDLVKSWAPPKAQVMLAEGDVMYVPVLPGNGTAQMLPGVESMGYVSDQTMLGQDEGYTIPSQRLLQ